MRWGEQHCWELPEGSSPSPHPVPGGVNQGIAHQACHQELAQLPLSLLPDRGLCSAVQRGSD